MDRLSHSCTTHLFSRVGHSWKFGERSYFKNWSLFSGSGDTKKFTMYRYNNEPFLYLKDYRATGLQEGRFPYTAPLNMEFSD